ncbi:hypothetical protein TrST_g2775 [Triparma strigata]|uniref:Uncharacterized protein n=1 Tax=Triparma strigata TaxID=1606541 RepID=A0A9W7B6N4_9STRA|nr:hypothetical protein TrST_g2775 [Triparma strigata]
MGNCSAQNKVYVTASAGPARTNPYAIETVGVDGGGGGGGDAGSANNSTNKAGGVDEGFSYHNLEDIKDGRSDDVEVPLAKGEVEFEDDIDPSKVDDVTKKLNEYKEELKKKKIGTRKKKVKNTNLIMNDNSAFGAIGGALGEAGQGVDVEAEMEGKGKGLSNANMELLEEADRTMGKIKISHSLAAKSNNNESDDEFDF